MTVEIGGQAPAFTLEGDGGTIDSASLRGKTVVLYFYPKDDTSGCTAEAMAFTAAAADFEAAGAVVVGVSRDTAASHGRFRSKYGLAHLLGADASGAVTEAYGVWVKKSMYGREYMGIERATFLIDRQGVVRGVWRKVKVKGHVDEVLAAARDLTKN